MINGIIRVPNKSRLIGLQLAIFLLLVPIFASAQSIGRVERTNTNINSYYYFVEPGVATLQVHVLGTIRSPGLYEIGETTSLEKLYALAGGAVTSPLRNRDRRRVTVQLYRGEVEGHEPLYEAVLGRDATKLEGYPSLRDGDILMVEVVERSGLQWRDFLTIIGTVASIALAAERFSRLL